MKEKKVSQSATKIRIISCTAAPCVPFRPQCAFSPPVHPLPPASALPFVAARRSPPRQRAASSAATSRHFPKAVRPSAKSMRKARGFSLFPSTFPRKTHLSKKRSCVLLPPPRRRARPHGRGAGEKFHIAAEKVRRNAHAFTFFYFCLLSMREKHAIFASKTCFINSAWQKRGRSSPFFVSPPECPDTSLPSL